MAERKPAKKKGFKKPSGRVGAKRDIAGNSSSMASKIRNARVTAAASIRNAGKKKRK